jgi:hypothetical protein
VHDENERPLAAVLLNSPIQDCSKATSTDAVNETAQILICGYEGVYPCQRSRRDAAEYPFDSMKRRLLSHPQLPVGIVYVGRRIRDPDRLILMWATKCYFSPFSSWLVVHLQTLSQQRLSWCCHACAICTDCCPAKGREWCFVPIASSQGPIPLSHRSIHSQESRASI